MSANTLTGAPFAGNRQAGRIRGLILDYGEVLCHRPAPDKMERMARDAGLDPETFDVRYYQERAPYDRGELNPADYWSRVVSGNVALGEELLGTLRQRDVEMWSDINRDMTEWLYEVHAAGLKTALLSNMHPDMALHARRSFDWLQHLDCVILSCEVRLVKPGYAIFKRCLEDLELLPFEACFIDDRDENVKAARETGLTAPRFQTVESLRDDLRGIGIPVLPIARQN